VAVILTGIAPFFVIVALGAGFARFGRIDMAGVRAINVFVFYLAMPALLLSVLLRLGGSAAFDPTFIAVYGAASLVHYATAFILARGAQRLSSADAAGQAMVGAVGNTTFLALPLTLRVFGDAAAPSAALAALIDNVLIMPIAVAALLAASGARGFVGGMRAGALGVVRNPIVIAAVLGLIGGAVDMRPPALIMSVVDLLAVAASPTALFALGAMIALNAEVRGREMAAPAAWAVGVKLVVFPALVFGALSLAGVDPLVRAVGVLFAAAPTAVNVFVQTTAYAVYARQATAGVAATTAVSLLTISLWLLLVAPELL